MINQKTLVSINIALLLSYLSFWFFSYFFPNAIFDNYSSLFFAIVTVLFSVLSLYASSVFNRLGNYFKTPSLIMSLGLLCNGLGDVFWYILGINGNTIDYPSVADVWYILFYPITFLGVHVLFLYISKEEIRLPRLVNLIYIESILLFLLGSFISLRYSSLPVFSSFTLDLSSTFDVLYMIADLFLLVHVFVILGFISNYPKAEHHLIPILYLMAFSFLLTFIADILFGYSTELGIYETSGFVDIIFLLFSFVMSISIIRLAYAAKPKFFKI